MERVVPRSEIPAMTVVTVTLDTFERIRKTIQCLRAQTLSEQLEILIVAPSKEKLDLDHSELNGFASYRVIEMNPIHSSGKAVAAAALVASAPIFAYAEEHAFPRPDWAAEILQAHQKPYAAVGVTIANANPTTATSWAHLIAAFGRWMAPTKSCETNHLPWHHTAYKLDLLLEYGDSLEAAMEAEGVLHQDLAVRGHRLFMSSDAITEHINISRLTSLFASSFFSGWAYAGIRARRGQWHPARRLTYIAGSPLLPALRFWRSANSFWRIQQSCRSKSLSILMLLVGESIANSFGELIGYVFGACRAVERHGHYELDRASYLSRAERRKFSECHGRLTACRSPSRRAA